MCTRDMNIMFLLALSTWFLDGHMVTSPLPPLQTHGKREFSTAIRVGIRTSLTMTPVLTINPPIIVTKRDVQGICRAGVRRHPALHLVYAGTQIAQAI